MTLFPTHLTSLALTITLLAGCAESEPAATAPAAAVADGSDHVKTEGPEGHGEAAGHDAHGEGEALNGQGAGGKEHHEMETLPIENRLAFMSGHVEAGLALYRAGAADQAAPHLLHPVSETHAAERAGLDALGFEADVFETVSEALDAGRPAAEIEPQLKAAEANMALMQEKAGGSPRAVIEYLMGTVDEEYGIGVKEGKVTDPGEYQDAYGFSVVALKTAQRAEAPELVAELEVLVGMWPAGGPLADSTPRSVADVTAQTARARKALTSLK